jgi:Co/Zn/Cd efflux system component
MGTKCCGPQNNADQLRDKAYNRILWIVLIINFAMFLIEVIAGLAAGSVSLQADALDFLADSANYAISLFVVGMALRRRAQAAIFKGVTMALFGLWVIGNTLWHVFYGDVPDAMTMGVVGVAALISNAVVFALLWSYRHGDSNMRSVWVCSRNDVIGNFAVLLAALGVFGTSTAWPDIVVATVMALLSMQGACIIIKQAFNELQSKEEL